jgi:hypothetical protein
MKHIALAAAIALMAGSTAAREVMVKIGSLEARGGKIAFDVTQKDGGPKVVYVFVTDQHAIKTNLLSPNGKQLRELRALIDATIIELEGAPPQASAPAQPAASAP